MRFQLIRKAKEIPFRFRCFVCGFYFRTDINDGCAVDLHGPMFEAYYCGECARTTALAHGVEVEPEPK